MFTPGTTIHDKKRGELFITEESGQLFSAYRPGDEGKICWFQKKDIVFVEPKRKRAHSDNN